MGSAPSTAAGQTYVSLGGDRRANQKNAKHAIHFQCPAHDRDTIVRVCVNLKNDPKKTKAFLAQMMGVDPIDVTVKNPAGKKITLSKKMLTEETGSYICEFIKHTPMKSAIRKDPAEKISNPKQKSKPKPECVFPDHRFSEATLKYLRTPNFNVWDWSEDEMISLIYIMFEGLDVIVPNDINTTSLKNFIVAAKASYRNNPFHNFRHAFCVVQMKYGLIHLLDMKEHFTKMELLCMLLAALCHDMDHPGYSNSYLINSRDELAIRYNDISPLENHHCAMCFKIMKQEGCNILCDKSMDEFRVIRKNIVQIILATDMVKHSQYVKDWVEINEDFDRSDPAQRLILMKMLMKCCDISNEIRPTQVSDKWLDKLLEEYFAQGDLEREMGLPTLPFMDRTKTTRSSAQIGFIKFVLIPLFQTLKPTFGEVVEKHMVMPLQDSADRFTKIAEEKKKLESEIRKLEDEKKKMEEDAKNADANDEEIVKGNKSPLRLTSLTPVEKPSSNIDILASGPSSLEVSHSKLPQIRFKDQDTDSKSPGSPNASIKQGQSNSGSSSGFSSPASSRSSGERTQQQEPSSVEETPSEETPSEETPSEDFAPPDSP